MAISCPRCGNTIDQDFGVAACPQCQALLFINMDGNVEITDESPVEPDFQPVAQSHIEDILEPLQPPLVETEPAEIVAEIAEIEEDPQATGIFESSEQVLGALSYSVKIENIDTMDIRLQIAEALDDPKFQWDPREIIRSLKGGALELKNLNPVKASVLVKRVRDIPVKVSWKQEAYN